MKKSLNKESPLVKLASGSDMSRVGVGVGVGGSGGVTLQSGFTSQLPEVLQLVLSGCPPHHHHHLLSTLPLNLPTFQRDAQSESSS